MYYEERIDGTWQRIEVQGEMLMGPAHHVIYFASTADWQRYPDWARGRRDEIIARIKTEFHAPDYEYFGGEPTGASPSIAPRQVKVEPSANPPVVKTSRPAPVRGMGALLLVIVLMLTISGITAGLVTSGIAKGETMLPLKRATLRRTVIRAEEPGLYWLSIGVYAVIGLGTLGLGVWCIGERRKIQEGRS